MGHCSDCHKFTSVNLIFSDSGILSLPVELIKKNNDTEREFFWGGMSMLPLTPHARSCFLLPEKKA